MMCASSLWHVRILSLNNMMCASSLWQVRILSLNNYDVCVVSTPDVSWECFLFCKLLNDDTLNHLFCDMSIVFFSYTIASSLNRDNKKKRAVCPMCKESLVNSFHVVECIKSSISRLQVACPTTCIQKDDGKIPVYDLNGCKFIKDSDGTHCGSPISKKIKLSSTNSRGTEVPTTPSVDDTEVCDWRGGKKRILLFRI